MRALFVVGALCATLLATPASRAAVSADIPMNQQITTGTGDAIYIPSSFAERLSFGSDATGGFTHVSIAGGSWYYGPYVDFVNAGIGPLDMTSCDNPLIEFDARYFQPESNTQRYSDAPIFLRMYSYSANDQTLLGWKDFGIVYATQRGDKPYPDWTHVVVPWNMAGINPSNASPEVVFDPHTITRMRLYGTDWYSPANQYGSFIDVKNLRVSCPAAIPEPGSIALLLSGALPLLALRRRKA